MKLRQVTHQMNSTTSASLHSSKPGSKKQSFIDFVAEGQTMMQPASITRYPIGEQKQNMNAPNRRYNNNTEVDSAIVPVKIFNQQSGDTIPELTFMA